MYVCVCNAVSEQRIRDVVAEDGVTTFEQLSAKTGVSTCCGCCEMVARQVLEEALAETRGASWHSAA